MTTLAEQIGGPKRVIGGPFGSKLTSADYVPDGIPVLRGSNMERNGRWIGGEFAYVTPAKVAADLSPNLAARGDIIVTQRGTLGQVSIVPDAAATERFVISQSQMAISVDPKRASRDFVYYYLRSPAFAEYLSQSTIQTGVPHINLGILRQAPANWPALFMQEQIARTLAIFDDKIELNRRMNQTLEAMAQAIFRDWFVDFGPVRRKMEGATDPVAIMGGLIPDPARATELAALFPGTLDEYALPVGWGEETVIVQANWVNGAAYKKMHFVLPGEGLPVIKIAELKAGVTANTGFTNTDLGSRYRIDDGELLFSWSGNPDTSIDTFIWTGGPAWLNQHIFAVRPNGSRTLGFLFAMLKYLNPTFAEIARDKQTTGLGHVTKEDLKRLRQAVPDRTVEAAFNTLMTPIFQKLKAAQLENRTLAETRDYLLPRLMSGEVTVGGLRSEAA